MCQKKYAFHYSILLACLSLFACGGGSNGNETANLLPSVAAEGSVLLARTVALPEGARCAQGGFQIASGEDKNKDGELQDGEVLREEIICNGKNILLNDGILPFDTPRQFWAGAMIECASHSKEPYDSGWTRGELRSCGKIRVNGFPLLVRGIFDLNYCPKFGLAGRWATASPLSLSKARKLYEWDGSGQKWVFVDIAEGESVENLYSMDNLICLVPAP